MAPLRRWIAGLVLAGSLVSCAPQTDDSDLADATTTDDGSAADIGSLFVSDLIANATAADEEQTATEKRSLLTCSQDSSLVVNLGYAKYRGSYDSSTGISSWKGSEHPSVPPSQLVPAG
jgi:hypothetical protein